MFCALIFSALFLFFQLKKNSLERPSVLAFNRLNGCYWKVFFLLLFDCYFYFLDYLIRMAGLERGFALLQQSWFSFEIASCFLCFLFFYLHSLMNFTRDLLLSLNLKTATISSILVLFFETNFTASEMETVPLLDLSFFSP